MVKEMLSADSYLPFLADQYGNYVVQKTLAVAEPEDLEQLLVKIKPDMKQLRETSDFGQKIYNKLVKTYPYLENKGLKVKTKPKRASQKSNKNSQKDKKNPPIPKSAPIQPDSFPAYQSYSQSHMGYPQNPNQVAFNGAAPQPGYYGNEQMQLPMAGYPSQPPANGEHQYY